VLSRAISLILDGTKDPTESLLESATMQLWSAIYCFLPRKIAKLTASLVVKSSNSSGQHDTNPISMIENLDPRVYKSQMALSIFLRVFFGHFLIASKTWYIRSYGSDQVDGYLQLQECGSVVMILDALSESTVTSSIYHHDLIVRRA
jgi:hypothetical protein